MSTGSGIITDEWRIYMAHKAFATLVFGVDAYEKIDKVPGERLRLGLTTIISQLPDREKRVLTYMLDINEQGILSNERIARIMAMQLGEVKQAREDGITIINDSYKKQLEFLLYQEQSVEVNS